MPVLVGGIVDGIRGVCERLGSRLSGLPTSPRRNGSTEPGHPGLDISSRLRVLGDNHLPTDETSASNSPSVNESVRDETPTSNDSSGGYWWSYDLNYYYGPGGDYDTAATLRYNRSRPVGGTRYNAGAERVSSRGGISRASGVTGPSAPSGPPGIRGVMEPERASYSYNYTYWEWYLSSFKTTRIPGDVRKRAPKEALEEYLTPRVELEDIRLEAV